MAAIERKSKRYPRDLTDEEWDLIGDIALKGRTSFPQLSNRLI